MRCRNLFHAVGRSDHQRVRLNQAAVAAQHTDSPGTQQLLYATHQLIDDGLLVSHQPRQIDRCRGNRHTELRGPFGTDQEVQPTSRGPWSVCTPRSGTCHRLWPSRPASRGHHAGRPQSRRRIRPVPLRVPLHRFVRHLTDIDEFPFTRVLPRAFPWKAWRFSQTANVQGSFLCKALRTRDNKRDGESGNACESCCVPTSTIDGQCLVV